MADSLLASFRHGCRSAAVFSPLLGFVQARHISHMYKRMRTAQDGAAEPPWVAPRSSMLTVWPGVAHYEDRKMQIVQCAAPQTAAEDSLTLMDAWKSLGNPRPRPDSGRRWRWPVGCP